MDLERMKHADIMAMFKDYYGEVLERSKTRIDNDGPLSQDKVLKINSALETIDELIESNLDDAGELYGLEEQPEESSVHQALLRVMKNSDLNYEVGSKEYEVMKKAHKYVWRNHLTDLLTYNDQVTDYSLLGGQEKFVACKGGGQLAKIVEDYLNEIEPTLGKRALNEQRDCLNYLVDALGAQYSIGDIDVAVVQSIKAQLSSTPTGRNKGKLTRGLSLSEQIEVAKKNDLPKLSTTSVNKYLTYFSSLCGWAHQNKIVSENLFKGIRVKSSKKKHRRRDHFTQPEVTAIIENLGGGEKTGLVKSRSYYWGALLAVYTGARLNEIASLLPDDIKQDESTKIWYLAINDEEESKRTKSDAATRIVPIHSQLIEHGFLEYVEEAKGAIEKRPKTRGQNTRLLYDLTYTDHDGWGRKLGRWFNEKYLVAINLKTDKKTLHSLRHSFITNLSAARVEFAHIRAVVGHEAGTVTEVNYAHFGIEHLKVFKEAIEALTY
ncbi:MAG: site-specific integrase [Alphaproteobacteria bacterium]